MDVAKGVCIKIKHILSKLKLLQIIRSYSYKFDIGKVDEDYKDCLAEVEDLLNKCEEKIRLKPRHAEIRNVIGELVRKKNINQDSPDLSEEENTTVAEELEDYTRRFKTEKPFKNRVLTFPDEKRFLCEFCGEKFSRYSSVKSHIFKLHSPGNIVTSEGDFSVTDKEEPRTKPVIGGNDIISSEPFNSSDKVCKEGVVDGYCRKPDSEDDQPTGNSVNLTLLCNTNQSDPKEDKMKRNTSRACPTCNRNFRLERSLKKHMRLKHSPEKESEFECDKCNKIFPEKGKLNRHVASHEQGLFQCDDCNRTFHRADNLKRHIAQLHQKLKTFECRYCHKQFSLKFNRDAHEKNVHESDAEIQCESCGKKCKNKSTFDKHKKIHEENPFSCTLCSKKFIRKVQYRNHLKVKHKGISPFQKLFDSFAKITPESPS